MISSATASIFLTDSRNKALDSLAFMENGIAKYASSPKANEAFVAMRLEKLESLNSYFRQLEETISIQNRELSQRYNNGFAAGCRSVSPDQPKEYERNPERLGILLGKWLDHIKEDRVKVTP